MYTSARISQHYLHNSYTIRTHPHIWNNLSQTNLQACIFACHAPFNLQHTHEHVESRIVVVVNCRHRQHTSVRLFKLLILHRIPRSLGRPLYACASIQCECVLDCRVRRLFIRIQRRRWLFVGKECETKAIIEFTLVRGKWAWFRKNYTVQSTYSHLSISRFIKRIFQTAYAKYRDFIALVEKTKNTKSYSCDECAVDEVDMRITCARIEFSWDFVLVATTTRTLFYVYKSTCTHLLATNVKWARIRIDETIWVAVIFYTFVFGR